MAPAGQEPGHQVEALQELLKTDDVDTRWRAVCALSQMSEELDAAHAPAISGRLGDPDPSVRQYAGNTLARMGTPGVRALIQAVEKSSEDIVQESALEALGNVGESVVTTVRSRLGHNAPNVRRRAALSLGQMAPWATQYAEDLAMLLNDKEGEVRDAGVQALVAMGKKGAAVLSSQLASPFEMVRRHAVKGVVQLQEVAAEHAVAVARLLDDPDDEVRDSARMAVAGLGPQGAALLAGHLDGDDPDGRRTAMRGLSLIAGAAVPMELHISTLVSCLKDKDELLRSDATEALTGVGKVAALAAASPLADLLADSSELVRVGAEEALCVMGSEALGRLMDWQGIESKDPTVRTAAIRVIGRLGPEAMDKLGFDGVIGHIAVLLADPEPEVRFACTQTFGMLPPGLAAPHKKPLAALVWDDTPYVQQGALLALGALGAEVAGEAVMNDAAQLLKDGGIGTRASAAKALGLFGEAAYMHARPLAQRLKEDANPSVRRNAAEALGLMGAAAGQFMQSLSKGLQDSDDDVRHCCLEAFGRLAVTAPQATAVAAPTLAPIALRDPSESIRAVALTALRKVGKAGVACIMASLSDLKSEPKIRAMDAFVQLDMEEQEAYTFNVSRLLQDADIPVRRRAAEVVGLMGPPGIRYVPGLRALLQDPDSSVQAAAAMALRALGSEAIAHTAEDLARNFTHPEGAVRSSATLALGVGGDVSKVHVPTICQMLLDEDTGVRQSAVQALGDLGEVAGNAVPALAEVLRYAYGEPELLAVIGTLISLGEAGLEVVAGSLQDPNVLKRKVCAQAVGTVGEAGGSHAVALAHLLGDIDPAVRSAAHTSLIQTGSAGASCLAEFLAGLLAAQVEPSLRQSIIEIMGHFGEVAAPHAVVVASGLVDCLRSVRRAAAMSIVEIGAETVPALLAGLESDDASVRRCAVEALGCLGSLAADSALAVAVRVADEDLVVQEVAILALGQLAPEGPAALAVQLKAAEVPLRRRSAEAIGRLGEIAAPQAIALASCLEDWSGADRDVLIWALGRMGPAGPKSLAALLGDARTEIKQGACGGLGRLGKTAARHAVEVAAHLGDRAAARSATEALLVFGEAGVAALASRVEDPDTGVRELVCDAIGRAGPLGAPHAAELATRLEDPELLVRRAAARALGKIGDAGKQHAAALAKRLEDPDAWVRARAAESLGLLGDTDHAAHLAELLDSQDFHAWVWQSAAEALRRNGSAHPDHAEPLEPRLADPDATVRMAAVAALGKLRGAAKSHLQAIVERMQDSDAKVRRSAIQAVGEMGTDLAAPFATDLATALEDSYAEARAAAATALGELGDLASPHAAAVAQALQDLESSVRLAAASALPKLGGGGVQHLDKLAPLLGDARASVREAAYAGLIQHGSTGGARLFAGEGLDASKPLMVRRLAAKGLAELGRDCAGNEEALTDLLMDSDAAVRKDATIALTKLGARGLAELEKLLQGHSEKGRVTAAEILGEIGPEADSSAGALAARLDDHSPLVRRAAAKALGRLGDGAKAQLHRIAELLEAQDVLLFKSALDTIGFLGRHASPHAQVVAFRLDAAGAEVRQKAAFALGSMGDPAARFDPDLVRVLVDAEFMVRANAAEALGKRGKAAAGYAAALEKLLEDHEGYVRGRAAEAIGRVLAGGGAPESAALLALRLQDSQLPVRKAAADALRIMGTASTAPYAVSVIRVIENSASCHEVTATVARIADLLAREFSVQFPHPLRFMPEEPAPGALFPLCAHADIPERLRQVLAVVHPVRCSPPLEAATVRTWADTYIQNAVQCLPSDLRGAADEIIKVFEISSNSGKIMPLSAEVDTALELILKPPPLGRLGLSAQIALSAKH